MQNLSDIAVIALGGTIAMTPGGGGGVVPKLTADDLVAAVPGLSDVARIHASTFRQVPGAHLDLHDAVDLAGEIERTLETCAGVVITQGTDTIDEMAYALDLLVRSPRPVVVTGAMRNPTVAGADGPANLLAAVQTAASAAAVGLLTWIPVDTEDPLDVLGVIIIVEAQRVNRPRTLIAPSSVAANVHRRVHRVYVVALRRQLGRTLRQALQCGRRQPAEQRRRADHA